MKKLDKKGFTLIELLAVIVVLAIVALIGYSTILPLLERTRKNAFATEANNVVDSAQNAITTYDLGLGTITPRTSTALGTGKYCFTLTDLKDASLLTKRDLTGYSGQVIVTITTDTNNNIKYSYSIRMKNDQYGVYSTTGAVSESDVKAASEVTGSFDCSAA